MGIAKAFSSFLHDVPIHIFLFFGLCHHTKKFDLKLQLFPCELVWLAIRSTNNCDNNGLNYTIFASMMNASYIFSTMLSLDHYEQAVVMSWIRMFWGYPFGLQEGWSAIFHIVNIRDTVYIQWDQCSKLFLGISTPIDNDIERCANKPWVKQGMACHRKGSRRINRRGRNRVRAWRQWSNWRWSVTLRTGWQQRESTSLAIWCQLMGCRCKQQWREQMVPWLQSLRWRIPGHTSRCIQVWREQCLASSVAYNRNILRVKLWGTPTLFWGLRGWLTETGARIKKKNKLLQRPERIILTLCLWTRTAGTTYPNSTTSQ